MENFINASGTRPMILSHMANYFRDENLKNCKVSKKNY